MMKNENFLLSVHMIEYLLCIIYRHSKLKKGGREEGVEAVVMGDS